MIEFTNPTTNDQVYVMIDGSRNKYVVDRKELIITESKQAYIQSKNGAVYVVWAYDAIGV